MTNGFFIALVFGLFASSWPHVAHASYVDPTTGGLLLQVIFGGLAGFAVIAKLFWHRFASLFNLFKFKRGGQSSGSPSDNAEETSSRDPIGDDA